MIVFDSVRDGRIGCHDSWCVGKEASTKKIEGKSTLRSQHAFKQGR